MQKIKIITDSACDIPQETADALDITVLPIPITHEGKSYLERVDFTAEEFYSLLLKSKTIPSTSHITSGIYVEEYKKALDEGCTHIINVTINSKGSNMFESASLAKRMFYEDAGAAARNLQIEVIDSRAYTVGYGIAVVEAARMVKDGADFETTVRYLYDWFDRLEIIFAVYSLEHAKKSGRISVAAAFMGELMGLRPIMSCINGDMQIIDKVRGDKNIVPAVLRAVKQRARGAEKYPVGAMRGIMYEEGQVLAEGLKEMFSKSNVPVYAAGASISINSGPKVIVAVYAGRKRDLYGTQS